MTPPTPHAGAGRFWRAEASSKGSPEPTASLWDFHEHQSTKVTVRLTCLRTLASETMGFAKRSCHKLEPTWASHWAPGGTRAGGRPRGSAACGPGGWPGRGPRCSHSDTSAVFPERENKPVYNSALPTWPSTQVCRWQHLGSHSRDPPSATSPGVPQTHVATGLCVRPLPAHASLNPHRSRGRRRAEERHHRPSRKTVPERPSQRPPPAPSLGQRASGSA